MFLWYYTIRFFINHSFLVSFSYYLGLFFIYLNVRLYLVLLCFPWSLFRLGILCFHLYLASPDRIIRDRLCKAISTFWSPFSKFIRAGDPKLKLTTTSPNSPIWSICGLIPWPGSYSLTISWSNSTFYFSLKCSWIAFSILFLIYRHHSGS